MIQAIKGICIFLVSSFAFITIALLVAVMA